MSITMSGLLSLGDDSTLDSIFDMPLPGIEATDLSSLLSQFEEVSQSLDGLPALPELDGFSTQSELDALSAAASELDTLTTPSDFDFLSAPSDLDGLSTPPHLELEPVPSTPPLLKSKSEEIKAEVKNPVITPPATPPPEVLARIRAKRKRKLAIMLPTIIPPKLNKGHKVVERSPPNSDANMSKPNISTDYYEHIPDHDYCVNSPKLSPKSKSDFVIPPPLEGDEVVIDAGDTSVLNNDLAGDTSVLNNNLVDNNDNDQELEEGEVPESPVQKHRPVCNSSNERKTSEKAKKCKRSYRQRDSSPVEDNERYFDKIPAYFTTLSKPVKPPPKKDKVEGNSGIRREDFIERDTSPSRPDSSVFDKLPAYYSCFTNSTRYDAQSDTKDSFDMEDLDRYQCAKKPRRYRSRSRSRSRSYSRSRSRSYSRSRSRRRRRSYSSASGSSCSSRSRSRYSSSSSSSSRSRSRSRSFSRCRSYSRSMSRDRSRSSRRRSTRSRYRSYSRSSSRSRSRSRSTSAERRRQERKERKEKEKQRQIEERRIVYVGKIPEAYTRRELRKRFGRFGDIEEVSVHFREYGDNYGFVTFAYTCDAYAAIEKGNDIPGEKRFDLCFGGRRQFCDTVYADLDGNKEADEEFAPLPSGGSLDFDQLLKQAKQSQKRKR